MIVRHVTTSDDRAAISRIYEQSWKSAYRDIIPQDYLDSIPEGRWVGAVDTPGWYTLVCVEDGEHVGTCSYCKSRFEQHPDSGEIISIYLLPEHVGKGFGRQLLEAALDELKGLGFDDAFLWVLEDNWHARHFYENCGFTCTGESLDANIGGKDLREVCYIRSLG